jgi:hypothetical protein
MSDSDALERARDNLTAFLLVAIYTTAPSIKHLGTYGGEIARTLWPKGGAPRVHTWGALTARAIQHAKAARIKLAASALPIDRESVVDTAIASEHGQLRDVRIEDLCAMSARLLFTWAGRVEDAKQRKDRQVLGGTAALMQHDLLMRLRTLVSLIDEPAALLAPIDAMLAKSLTLLLGFANPARMSNVDPANTAALFLGLAAQREKAREDLGEEEPAVEDDDAPERAPAETVARLERVSSELTEIAAPLGARVDAVLFADGPAAPVTFERVLAALDARFGQEEDTLTLGRAREMDDWLLGAGPPSPRSESLFVRASDALEQARERIAEASGDDALEIAEVAEQVLHMVAVSVAFVAQATGEEARVARLAQMVGL